MEHDNGKQKLAKGKLPHEGNRHRLKEGNQKRYHEIEAGGVLREYGSEPLLPREHFVPAWSGYLP